mgnify:CR=1 FL=1
MARFGALLTAFLITLAAPAAAQERPVLVELYTSQGCSSCPPADAFLHKLASRDDVIALALHVDYWDYIGWKDSFARPEYTARQRAYAKVANRRMVYTPQMIINGTDHVVGTRPMDVKDLIRKHHGGASEVALSVAERQGKLEIDATAAAGTGGTATVRLFRYLPQETVAIKRGENRLHLWLIQPFRAFQPIRYHAATSPTTKSRNCRVRLAVMPQMTCPSWSICQVECSFPPRLMRNRP